LHLLALPRNWRIHCDQIMSETGTGQRPFWRYWNELKHTGFIVVRRTRSPDGKGFGSPISTFTTSQR
jgi:hypothetical protein